MRTRLPISLACALLTASAIAACGGSSSSGNGIASEAPAAILKATVAAANGVKSMHVAGSVASTGTAVTLDLDLDAAKGATGSMSEGGLGFKIVSVNKALYINAGDAFWKHFGGAAAATLFANKWIEAPTASNAFGSLSALTNLHDLFTQLLGSHGALTKTATKTVNGQQAVGLLDKTKGGTLYVATSGQPYPLEIVGGGANTGTITFSNFNVPVTVTPPPHPVNLSQLKG
jgi:hypothetical protein